MSKHTDKQPQYQTELELLRLNDNGDSTTGVLRRDFKFECYTLEDQFQQSKISGETRIPAGRYEIKFREVLSGLTQTYRNKYDWFTWHLELQDVPGFQYVYIHIGNDDDDTDACILVGDSQSSNANMQRGFIGHSRNAFKRLYLELSRTLNSGQKVFITIFDE